MTLRKLWAYLQLVGLFAVCPILLVPFMVGGFLCYVVFLRVNDSPALMYPLGVAVFVLIALRGAKGRAVFAERARQKGAPPVTKMD